MIFQGHNTRSGSVTVLTAILMVFLVGMVAFAVDLGYVALVRNEVQNAADAAALAAVPELISRKELVGDVGQTAEVARARDRALEYAGRNRGGGVALAVDRNDANDPAGDVVVGTLASARDAGAPLALDKPPYNAVQVTVHRDEVRNGRLDLFFAPVLGTRYASTGATATAIMEGNVRGFKIATDQRNSKLLPFTLDLDTWNRVLSKSGPDDFSYDPATRAIVPDKGDGIHEANLYPGFRDGKSLSPGNFGTVNIGLDSNSSAVLEDQIRNGINAEQLARMGGSVELGPDETLTLPGNPGLSAGFKDALEAIKGQPRIIPIYKSVHDTGATTKYIIVKFVGIVILDVRIAQVPGGIRQMSLTIQPEQVIDSSALGGGTTETGQYIYRPPVLAR